jgi:hypothetical protein
MVYNGVAGSCRQRQIGVGSFPAFCIWLGYIAWRPQVRSEQQQGLVGWLFLKHLACERIDAVFHYHHRKVTALQRRDALRITPTWDAVDKLRQPHQPIYLDTDQLFTGGKLANAELHSKESIPCQCPHPY